MTEKSTEESVEQRETAAVTEYTETSDVLIEKAGDVASAGDTKTNNTAIIDEPEVALEAREVPVEVRSQLLREESYGDLCRAWNLHRARSP